MTNSFYNKSILKLSDFTSNDIHLLLDIANRLKNQKKLNNENKYLSDKNIALIFEKSSTRTRISFEVAAYDQGANVTYLDGISSQLGHKESVKDTARVLGRMYDAIQYRGGPQKIVEELAYYSGVPVYNGLTDDFHPTQGLADLMTMQENSGKDLSSLSFCFVGDCRFNMANTLLLAGSIMGMDVRLLCPKKLMPRKDIIEKAKSIAKSSGATILVTDNPDIALFRCDFVHTDIWVSMGEKYSVWRERIDILKDYQVNETLMKKTNNHNVKFMHCLPALHNLETDIGKKINKEFGLNALEVSDDVFEGDSSIVFDQAENRLHTIKAILVTTMAKDIDFINLKKA